MAFVICDNFADIRQNYLFILYNVHPSLGNLYSVFSSATQIQVNQLAIYVKTLLKLLFLL